VVSGNGERPCTDIMVDGLYFDGDPATDSARRHLERVLKEPERRRRWPWVGAGVMAAAAWYFWPRGTREERPSDETSGSTKAR
jgi:hypothetical protein